MIPRWTFSYSNNEQVTVITPDPSDDVRVRANVASHKRDRESFLCFPDGSKSIHVNLDLVKVAIREEMDDTPKEIFEKVQDEESTGGHCATVLPSAEGQAA